jgi:alpha 1,2-mannosyltransferase
VSFRGGVWRAKRKRADTASAACRPNRALPPLPPLTINRPSHTNTNSERDAPRDKACHERVWIGSGFCECAGGLVARPSPCGRHGGFVCARECAARLGSGGDATPALPPPTPGDPAPRLPSNLTCEAGGPTAAVLAADAGSPRAGVAAAASAAAAAAAGVGPGGAWAAPTGTDTPPGPALAAADAGAAALWSAIRAAADASWDAAVPPGRRVTLPERRTDARDWVAEGLRLPPADVSAAAAALAAFRSSAPPYPSSNSSASSFTYAGRGVVILGGGLTYMVPAWVALHMLRRAGSSLPVEVWFPAAEAPTPGLVSALARLGAGTRILPAAPPPSNGGLGPRGEGRNGPAGGGDLSGFTMKIAALLLSRFREVLFLDSDNVALSDPASLFDSPAYAETGALLWPDYWASTAAPDLATILGVKTLPPGTFESGQLVFDKARAWAGLLTSAYFNLESDLYYELFSGFMGKGDKEGFAHGLAAAGLPYALAPTPAGSVGRPAIRCALNQRVCGPGFAGNTMTQHAFPMGVDEGGGTKGKGKGSQHPPVIAFLHANLSPKWNLALPATPESLARRWVTLQPGGRDFRALAADAGLPDLEAEAFAIAAGFACADFTPSYAAALSASVVGGKGGGGGGGGGSGADSDGSGGAQPPPDASTAHPHPLPLSVGLPPHSLHPANPGIDFRAAYRLGLGGPFEAWAGLTFYDRALHAINGRVRPRLAWVRRVGRWVRGREYFVPF